jgi:hypothetical protein
MTWPDAYLGAAGLKSKRKKNYSTELKLADVIAGAQLADELENKL